MQNKIQKYPRTKHLENSRLQPGDEGMGGVPFVEIKGQYIVVEEKIDGANAAISFAENGELLLQSRGHYLTGGQREKHFNLMKTWAKCHRSALEKALENRYIMYGEWCYARHTIFYDMLPHYFMEFDVLDREKGIFLSTQQRQLLLQQLPIASVPVLYAGLAKNLKHLLSFVGPSRYKSVDWRDRLITLARQRNLNVELVLLETEDSKLMEGLYIKVENNGEVIGRYKWIRAEFLQTVYDSGSHWLNRPIIPNQLAPSVDIYRQNDP